MVIVAESNILKFFTGFFFRSPVIHARFSLCVLLFLPLISGISLSVLFLSRLRFSGEALIEGEEAYRIPDRGKRTKFGYVEQSFHMVPGTVCLLALDQRLTGIRPVKSQKQLKDRTLSGAGAPRQRHLLAWVNCET